MSSLLLFKYVKKLSCLDLFQHSELSTKSMLKDDDMIKL